MRQQDSFKPLRNAQNLRDSPPESPSSHPHCLRPRSELTFLPPNFLDMLSASCTLFAEVLSQCLT